jgi:8-oxo-dGTP pyrophosphatase MutT (NUDIX family)
MATPERIRVIVLGLIRDGDRLFVSEGYDSVKQQYFYRALGGGVEFGETSLAALQREFQEEISAELINIQYLGCIENLFIYNDRPGHELVQLYQCDFADPQFYQTESLMFQDDDCSAQKALWLNIEQFKTGMLRLVPEQILNYL